MAELEVLYEDAWLLAADKPAGVLVHGDGTGAPTLTDAVRAQLVSDAQALEAASDAPAAEAKRAAVAQLQPVQRLDVDTTGIVLFSKDKAVQPKLDALVAAHDGIRKRYLALARGAFPWERRVLRDPIGRDRHDAHRMRVDRGGKPAETRVTCLGTAGARATRTSLLLVELRTGRRHQIRVHLASAGFPLVGDALYGVPADRRGHTPLMLHAYEECLVHPVTGETLVIRTSVPERFAAAFPNAEGLAAKA